MRFSVVRRRGCHSSSDWFRLSPLATLVFVGVGLTSTGASAAFLPPTGAGQLGNQLRQETQTTPPAPSAPSLSLPSGEKGVVRAPDSDARVTLKQVSFAGDVAVQGVTQDAVQEVVSPWLNRPVSFADLQAMADAVTQHYRNRGVILARAILPPQTIKDGVLKIEIIPGKYDNASL
ncbi:TPA: POTRA domain-containing protein, partial [Salmonella enterica subsp. enterica serovar Newport]